MSAIGGGKLPSSAHQRFAELFGGSHDWSDCSGSWQKPCERGDRSLTIALSPTGPLITTGGRLIWLSDSADFHHGPSEIGTA